jgi:uncharacterized protein YndB with AHSA1/START domain
MLMDARHEAHCAVRAGARGTATVEARRWYAAARDAVFRAWVEPALVRRWLFATAAQPYATAAVDARAGGRLRLVTCAGATAVAGRFDDVIEPMRLQVTLHEGADARTKIEARLQPQAGGTTLHVRHTRVPAHRADWLDGRWSGMLYGLAEALDCDSHELFHPLESR